jgi:site-specific recombinase XerD
MNYAETLSRLVQDFFRMHLVGRRDVSPNTVSAYRDTMRMLLSFSGSQLSHNAGEMRLDDLNRETVLAFLDHLQNKRGNSASTRNARLAAVHSFFQFVAQEDPTSIHLCQRVLSIPYKRTVARAITCLDRQEIEHILGSIDRRNPSGRRDATLLQLLYNTGARAQEVVDLRLPAIRLSAPAQVRILGKGRKERLCPLWPETASLVKDMLKDRCLEPHEDVPLFVNAVGQPLSRFGLRHIVKRRVALAIHSRPSLAAKRITPHTFRHSTAMHLIQSGVEINVVRSWLGHASIETTHAYIEIDMQMKAAALEACGATKAGKGHPRWPQPNLLAWLESL